MVQAGPGCLYSKCPEYLFYYYFFFNQCRTDKKKSSLSRLHDQLLKEWDVSLVLAQSSLWGWGLFKDIRMVSLLQVCDFSMCRSRNKISSTEVFWLDFTVCRTGKKGSGQFSDYFLTLNRANDWGWSWQWYRHRTANYTIRNGNIHKILVPPLRRSRKEYLHTIIWLAIRLSWTGSVPFYNSIVMAFMCSFVWPRLRLQLLHAE